MQQIDILRELSEVWKLFGEMPDTATVNAELASVYLGISLKTLARYRQNGDGPTYIQYQAEDTKARNQRVLYILEDLRIWRDNHKVKNTMHAAQVRGLAFTSLFDFCKPQPFWNVKILQEDEGCIFSHILTTPDEDFRKLLLNPAAEILCISVEEALFRKWKSAEERVKWNNLFVEFLLMRVSASNAAQEKHIFSEILK